MPSNEQGSTINEAYGQELLTLAKDAIAAASELVRSTLPRTLTFKGDRDITSDVDVAVENLVQGILRKQMPEAEFLGEEGGGEYAGETDRLHWVLDPIDGTINFIHGVPLCAVSLSVIQGTRTLAAVIDLPFLDAQYSGLLGYGSYVNNQKLHVSSTRQLNSALISIDQFSFGQDARRRNLARHSVIMHLASRVQRIRILGTSAIDLVWTAHGRLDACIMLGNKPWDTSAGVLIAQEAGARVLDLDGSNHTAYSSAVIAVTPELEKDLMSVLRAALTDATPTN